MSVLKSCLAGYLELIILLGIWTQGLLNVSIVYITVYRGTFWASRSSFVGALFLLWLVSTQCSLETMWVAIHSVCITFPPLLWSHKLGIWSTAAYHLWLSPAWLSFEGDSAEADTLAGSCFLASVLASRLFTWLESWFPSSVIKCLALKDAWY